MTKYLLDTNAVSEVGKLQKDAGFMDWLDGQDDSQLHISCLTIGEIQKGISLASYPGRRQELDNYLIGILEAFAGRLVNLTHEHAILWGTLMAKGQKTGCTPSAIDCLLAAQAIHEKLTLVTRNTKDFKQFSSLKMVCPWSN